ncbi:MAG: hypothetical protein AAFQ21_12400 [Pseudomonadota bacterium]
MATICISIENDFASKAFDRALREASAVARDMIEVRTSLHENTLVKNVHTDCPQALFVVRKALRNMVSNA